ncbi:hypothetical protein ACLESD_08685 [Pyxidicoccus sp. 3LFB2]
MECITEGGGTWWICISRLADISGILIGITSGILTVITLVKVNSVEQSILRVKRIPALRKALEKRASELRLLSQKLPSTEKEVVSLVAQIRADVENVKRKLPSSDHATVKSVMKAIASCGKPVTEDDAFRVSVGMSELATQLSHIEEDWKAGSKP